MRYLIIGNGVAGTTAARNIRGLDPEGEITILTEEALPFYSRIRLIDYLAGEIDVNRLVLHGEARHAQNRIGLRLNCLVQKIDKEKKEVIISTGESLPFDRLLIATGSSCILPPIPGADKSGVYTLRTIADAKRINDYSAGASDVVLIGGGILGLEAGNALRKKGKRICVVEFFARLLPRQTDEQGSGILKSQMEDMGFNFYLGAKTKEILGKNKVEAVSLEDGKALRADIVIISAGVKANTALAEAANIDVGKRGIIVDDRMETSEKGIYAAGDAAEHRGVMYGIWPAAEKEGEAAGINMAGGNAIFGGITPSNILKVAGIDLVSAGNIDAEGRRECIVLSDKDKYIYRKLVIENDCLAGCILLGPMEGRRKILKAIEEKRSIKDIKDRLMNWDIEVLS